MRRSRKRKRKRRRRTKRRRKRRSQLQCSLPQQCSGVVHEGQGNCFFFFPVNKGNSKEKEENKQNGKEISTTMKSSTAMQQSCAHGPRQLFLFFFYSVNKVENEKEEEENKENGKGITTTMQSSTAMQQRCTGCQGICFFPVNEEGEGEGGRGGGGGGGR